MHLSYPSCPLALAPAPTQTDYDLAPQQGIAIPADDDTPEQVRRLPAAYLLHRIPAAICMGDPDLVHD